MANFLENVGNAVGTAVAVLGNPVGSAVALATGAPIGNNARAPTFSSNPRAQGLTLLQRYSPQGGRWQNQTINAITITDGVRTWRVEQGGMIDQLASGELAPLSGTVQVTAGGWVGAPAGNTMPVGPPVVGNQNIPPMGGNSPGQAPAPQGDANQQGQGALDAAGTVTVTSSTMILVALLGLALLSSSGGGGSSKGY